ncbi:MAG: sulfite exporter TauE/SafE family protein [Pseudomonadota bacterium]
MNGINLIPVFMIGLLGSVHCVGMCGGIVGAFSAASVPKRAFPVPVVLERVAGNEMSGLDNVMRVGAYNAGRIASYGVAGAIAGGIAGGASAMTGISLLQIGGYWLANLMLVALGLYLMNLWHGLAWLELAGQTIWRWIQPLMKHLLPLDSPLKAFALGGLWGWLPCGMVYSILLSAMLSGSALGGAAVMLAFGLGTLPTLLSMGLLGSQLKQWARRPALRMGGGVIVLAFGIFGLLRAANGLPHSWLDTLCVTPVAQQR